MTCISNYIPQFDMDGITYACLKLSAGLVRSYYVIQIWIGIWYRIGSWFVQVYGLLSVRHQSITWTNVELLFIGPLGSNFSGISTIWLKSMAFCKTALSLLLHGSYCSLALRHLNILSQKYIWKCCPQNVSHFIHVLIFVSKGGLCRKHKHRWNFNSLSHSAATNNTLVILNDTVWGNGLVPSGIKPLPQTTLSFIKCYG